MLFRKCVHRVNIRDYTKEQVDAWAPAEIDQDAWRERFNSRFAYVAIENNSVVGFTDMTKAGHLDRLFVSADHQGQGIARRLVEQLIHDAETEGIESISTDASITAKSFFEKMGFAVVTEQSVNCRGVRLTNFQMRRG
nr:GNAT family N-acetyltransferase [Rhodopirellula sp. MGV]